MKSKSTPAIGDSYKLTKLGDALAKLKTRMRAEANAAVYDRQVAPRSRDIVLDGTRAEVAGAVLHNISFDLTLEPRSKRNGTDEGDGIYRGHTIDFKSTQHTNGRLIENAATLKPAAIYCLLIQRHEIEFEVRGYASGADLCQTANLIALTAGKPKVFCLLQPQLRSLEAVLSSLDTQSSNAAAK